MNAIVEIDKSGRIVIPRKFRDALGLTSGCRLRLERVGDSLTLGQELVEPRVEMRDGFPVLIGGTADNLDVNELIAEDRDRRMRYVAGLSDEP